MKSFVQLLGVLVAAALCAASGVVAAQAAATTELYGTSEPFASESIYFVVTDRFVNGDTSNDHRDQGGEFPSFDQPVPGAPKGEEANIGYLGGDFKGVLDNAGYIRDLGFTSVWVTPIVDNPDQSFSGGKPVTWGSFWTDRGKSGYHGYWGVNFHKLDEHLPSKGLDFAGFTGAMKQQKLDVVLDIVANHGSPAYTMPQDQPMFGEVYGKDGALIADHQNLPPEKLSPETNPLHAFYNRVGGLAELSDFDEKNPAVMDYLVEAYLKWIDQGAAAFRIDTIAWMPHGFWKEFADRIRAEHPGFFMFGEHFGYDAATLAGHTLPRNGGISVLDFPMRQKMVDVFEKPGTDFAELGEVLYLEDGPYANPYDLVTFYDNHDMARMNAGDEGFIDAHNWLFTVRGIPALYYGSETGFMRGRAEHAGNRNYFGQARVDAASESPIHGPLKRIATLRRETPALQRGLQLNLLLKDDRAAFYRVLERDGITQTALVMLNKGDGAADFELDEYVQPGTWLDALGGGSVEVGSTLRAKVAAHGIKVLLLDQPLTEPALRARLVESMQRRER